MCSILTDIEHKGRAEGRAEEGLTLLYDMTAAGDITITKAVDRAKKYGVSDEEDFRKRALIAGYKL